MAAAPVAAASPPLPAAPTDPLALFGRALEDQQAGRIAEAIDGYRAVLASSPRSVEAWTNLGSALRAFGDLDDAVAAYRRALAIRPGYPPAQFNLTLALQAAGRLDEALASARLAVAADRADPACHNTLGNALLALGRAREAADAFRAAVARDPTDPLFRSNLIFALDLLPGACDDADRERRRFEEGLARPLRAAWRPHANAPDPERPIRVGYVSADYRGHSAVSAILPILEAHDRAGVHVTLYSNAPSEDHITARCRASAARWRTVGGLTDEALAEQVRADEIDVLVDLSGHSAGNRLLAFARKPAPVQVTAWGYATGTGLGAIDYFLADAVTVPDAHRRFYAEEVVHLPAVLTWAAPSDAPAVVPPPLLARGSPTFGSFNRPGKLSDQALDLWGRILAAVPDARMLFKAPGVDCQGSRARIVAALARHGVGPERIELRGATDRAAHVAAYAEVDVVLDALPQGGGITALEDLWMGVPVVTLLGERVQGRIAASFLAALGVPETIARTPDEYVALAVALARDPGRLAALRPTLRPRLEASPIVDPVGYTRAVEAAYRTIWRRWCAERTGRA